MPLDATTAAQLQAIVQQQPTTPADPLGVNAQWPPPDAAPPPQAPPAISSPAADPDAPAPPVASYATPPAPNASVDVPISRNAPPGAVAFAPGAAPAGAPGAGPSLALQGVQAPGTKPVPAAWVPRGRETQSGITLSPETQEALQRYTAAGNQVDESLRTSFDAQQKIQRAAADANAQQSADDLREFQARQSRQAADRAAQWTKVQAAQKAVSDAQTQGVDPEHWMHSRTTGQRIALIIGAALSGWANPHGPNQVIEMAQKAISQDVDAQKASLAGKEHSLDSQMSLYGLMRQKGLDEDASADAAKLVMHQNLDAQIKAALPDAQNAMGKLTLQQALQENQGNMVQLRAAIDEKASMRSSTSEAFRPAMTPGVVSPQQILEDANAIYMRHYGEQGNSWEQAVRQAVRHHTGRDVLPGAPEMVVQKAGGGRMGRLAGRLADAPANIKALDDLAAISKQTVIGPQDQARAAQLLATLKSAGVQGLPEDSTITSRLLGSTQAAIAQARRDQVQRLTSTRDVVAGGGAGGGEDEAPSERDEAPEGFEEDK